MQRKELDFSEHIVFDEDAPERFLFVKDLFAWGSRKVFGSQSNDSVLDNALRAMRSQQNLPSILVANNFGTQHLDIHRITMM